MRAIFPGRPQSKPQSLCTASWANLRIIAYLSGNAVVILGGPQRIIQTIYIDNVESLEAITIEETSGRLAVCGGQHVYIYRPLGRDEGVLKWSQQYDLCDEDSDEISTLSWGSSEELVVGGTQVHLWNTQDTEEPSVIWRTTPSSPVRIARMSHDAGLIASCGHHDKLAKVWRRLSYEVDSTRFDVSYLPHPATITNLHWRKPWHAEQNLDHLLYTFCADDKVRVWAHSDPHSKSVMQFVTQIDLQTSIQFRTPEGSLASRRRYCFIIDSRDFSQATENAVQKSAHQTSDHALEHLIEVANRSPEICVVLDDSGHISAWGLENAGCKNKLPATVFNIVHVGGLHLSLAALPSSDQDYLRFASFAGGISGSSLTILVHHYDGRIDWHDAQLAELFDPGARTQRARLVSSWTGHDQPLATIEESANSNMVLSCSLNGQSILWKVNDQNSGPILQRYGVMELPSSLIDFNLSATGSLITTLTSDQVMSWSVRGQGCAVAASARLHSNAKPLQLVPIPAQCTSTVKSYFAVIYSDMSSTLFEAYSPPFEGSADVQDNGYHEPLRMVCLFGTKLPDASMFALLVPQTLDNLKSATSPNPIDRPSLLSVSSDGVLERLSARLDPAEPSAEWQSVSTTPTGITNPSRVEANSTGKAAVFDSRRTCLTIWDTVDGQLEYTLQLTETDVMEKLSWTSLDQGESILAIGCSYRILIIGQSRYSSPTSTEAWARIVDMRTRDFAIHPLGDLCWISRSNLLFGAGNQMFVVEPEVPNDHNMTELLPRPEAIGKSPSLYRLIKAINTGLPVFHPGFLYQLMAAGKFDLVRRVLHSLYALLRFSSEGDSVPSLLKLASHTFYAEAARVAAQNNSSTYSHDDEEDDETKFLLSAEKADMLQESLSKISLWQLTPKEQSALGKLGTQLASMDVHRRSLDANAFRYLHPLRHDDDALDALDSDTVTWREIGFAFHSTSQDILVDLVSRSFDGRLTWAGASKSGLFLWLSDRDALRTQMEVVGRNEYTNDADRNPVGCSLYYLALGKKSVLQGLWRMSVGNREKENTLKLLAHNFEEPRWKTTALKNAYVLLSKRRFEYAAAFFLLGGSLKDAVNVCAHQLGKVDLAVAIARVNEGDDGQVLKKLIMDTILPNAAETGNRWMASWAFEMLGQNDKAVQSLVRPLHTLVVASDGAVHVDATGTMAAKSFRNNEPSLALLYKHLRENLVKAHKWHGVISPKEEWNFVMRCCRQYVRMGCDLLALDLVRNWEFVHVTPPVVKDTVLPIDEQPSAVSEREADLRDVEQPKKAKKPPPTQFQEPSASSLLDSFGF